MSSVSEVCVWVNTSDLMKYKATIPTYQEPDMIKDIHTKIGADKCCIICGIVDSVDMSMFHPRFINGHLCVLCSDVRMLNISNGFIPKCIFHSNQMRTPLSASCNPYQTYNPYTVKAPNPYEMNSYSSSSRVIQTSTYDEIIRREMANKRREEICQHLKEICEDDSSILSGLIHIAYNRSIAFNGPDAICRVPGIVYVDINEIIIKCGKFMNQEIENINAIIQVIDEDQKYQTIMESCAIMMSMWNDIETWFKSCHVNPLNVFNEMVPRIYRYIDYFQNFAFNFNKTKIIDEPLSAVGLINKFVEKNTKN